jgi:hypothetical protein
MMSLLHVVAQPHRFGAFNAAAIAGTVVLARHSGCKTLLSIRATLLVVESFLT